MSEKQWMKFYPERWLSDPKLRMCSLAARGLLIDLMSVAHADGGWLKNDPKTYQRLFMTHHKTFSSAWQELVKEERILWSKPQGFWYIKRMVEEHDYYLQQKALGVKGAAKKKAMLESITLKAPLKGTLQPDKEEEKEEDKEGLGAFDDLVPF